MALPNLTFSVASEYDGKGLGKARKDINSFDKTVKNLGRTLGVTLSAAAIVQFGKASVRAFMDAEREGVVLANTMKNLGLAFDTSRVTNYINSVGKLYGVTGEQAVPAMQALLSATGSVTKSQELFNTALNVSASTGIDVAEVAKGLSQAYLGNRKALNQYNTGLTKAELQLKSFDEIQQTLDTRLKGSATDAAATYSGQLAILTENAEQAKEAIGKGLVDSFILLAGDNSLDVATSNMKKYGDQIAYALLGAADLLKKIQDIGKESEQGFVGPDGIRRTRRPSALEELSDRGRKVALENTPMGAPGAISGKVPAGAAYFALQEKADAAAIKRQKELAAIEKKRLDNLKKIASEAAKKLALDKASAFLNKANQIFDNDRIQFAAAAMSKQTEEDRVRIRLKTEIMDLEEAIAEGNVQGAAKFAAMISEDARLLGVLRGNAFALSSVPDPFAAWMASLQGALAALLAITNYVPAVSDAPENPGGINKPNYGTLSVPLNAGQFAIGERDTWREYLNLPKLAEGGIVNSATVAMIGEAGPEAVIPLSKMGSMGGTYVTVNISGSVTTERDLVDAITQGIYNNQASGIPINYSTVY
jgi:hypothetical protein